MCKMMGKKEKRQKSLLSKEIAGLTVASQLSKFQYTGQVKVIQERLKRDKNWDNFSSVAPI